MPETLKDTFTATALQNETLDALVWRVMQSGPVILPQVLDLNRGLADLGPYLPEGHVVTLPLKTTAAEVAVRETVKLWD